MAHVKNSHTKALRYFYNVYQFLAPLAFFPIAYWLWWRRFGRSHELALLVMFVPVVSYYLFVGIGMLRFRKIQLRQRSTHRNAGCCIDKTVRRGPAVTD